MRQSVGSTDRLPLHHSGTRFALIPSGLTIEVIFGQRLGIPPNRRMPAHMSLILLIMIDRSFLIGEEVIDLLGDLRFIDSRLMLLRSRQSLIDTRCHTIAPQSLSRAGFIVDTDRTSSVLSPVLFLQLTH